MFRRFYIWLYYYRQRKASRARLSGRMRRTTGFRLFDQTVFHRAHFGKYDLPRQRWRKGKKLLWLVAFILLGWIIWESFKAFSLFQP